MLKRLIEVALLRREDPVAKYPGLEAAFEITDPVILKEAARPDPDGVVRFPRHQKSVADRVSPAQT